MTWLVTGAAGFIGFHLCQTLLERGEAVVGVDNLDPYYDVALKHARLEHLASPGFTFHRADLCDPVAIEEVIGVAAPRRIVHLAARPGVRSSGDQPRPYTASNLVGFANLIELARYLEVEHFVYASSSSVYGLDALHESGGAEHPTSLYAATKRANELVAHSYSHLHGLPTTGVRLFSVYGPWGRPDMAYYAFARAISAGEPVRLFGDGTARRDFTFVDDVVEGLVRLALAPPEPSAAWRPPDHRASSAPFRLVDLARGRPVAVNDVLNRLEQLLERRARRRFDPSRRAESPQRPADLSHLEVVTGFRPSTDLDVGLRRFVAWFVAHETGRTDVEAATGGRDRWAPSPDPPSRQLG